MARQATPPTPPESPPAMSRAGANASPHGPAESPTAIDISNLRVLRRGRLVLDSLALTIPAGSVTGLLGPSGSGKTTLMRAIVGTQRTAGGTVRVLGEPAGHRALRDRVAYMTQALSVYTDLTVAENLRYYADMLGAPKTDPARVTTLVSLQGRERDLVGRLSGGQRARVSLAAALLGSPQLLVLDEPTVGLDPVLRGELWQLFHVLSASGTTLLVSSHVMDEASRCDALVLMREGRILAQGSPAELLMRTGAAAIEEAFLTLVAGAATRDTPRSEGKADNR